MPGRVLKCLMFGNARRLSQLVDKLRRPAANIKYTEIMANEERKNEDVCGQGGKQSHKKAGPRKFRVSARWLCKLLLVNDVSAQHRSCAGWS